MTVDALKSGAIKSIEKHGNLSRIKIMKRDDTFPDMHEISNYLFNEAN